MNEQSSDMADAMSYAVEPKTVRGERFIIKPRVGGHTLRILPYEPSPGFVHFIDYLSLLKDRKMTSKEHATRLRDAAQHLECTQAELDQLRQDLERERANHANTRAYLGEVQNHLRVARQERDEANKDVRALNIRAETAEVQLASAEEKLGNLKKAAYHVSRVVRTVERNYLYSLSSAARLLRACCRELREAAGLKDPSVDADNRGALKPTDAFARAGTNIPPDRFTYRVTLMKPRRTQAVLECAAGAFNSRCPYRGEDSRCRASLRTAHDCGYAKWSTPPTYIAEGI